MKITEVKAVYPSYRHVPPSWRTHFWQVVVRVEAQGGAVGYGYGGGGVAAVEVINRHLRELLVGRAVDEPRDIAALWDLLYRETIPYGRRGLAVMALSGVDLALWDLLGRAEGRAVYDLLGGLRKERVRAYATGVDVEWYAEPGFRAHKFPHRWTGREEDYEAAVEAARRARRALGPEALLMVDCYMTWDARVALRMASLLSEFSIYWFEDVLTPDEVEKLAALRPAVKPALLAGGEHEFTHHGFAELARSQALDLWQPDITWCGGITAGLRILEVARKARVPVAPHRGGEVWGLHFILATDCMDLAEVLPGRRGQPRDVVWRGEPQPQGGYLYPNEGPGFGVTPVEL